jgi:hypothetical protein
MAPRPAQEQQRSAQGQQSWPAPGTQDGNWVWDGSEWVCNPDCGNGYGGGVPPFGPPVFSGPVSQPPWYPGANGGVSFGQTFPPNPVRGHLFWDGTTFWLFDGAAWVGLTGGGGGSGVAVAAIGTTPPPAPVQGMLWFNGTALQVWNGTAWVVSVSSAAGNRTWVQASAPITPATGDGWWNGTAEQVWDGAAWKFAGPGARTYVQSATPTPPVNVGDEWWDTHSLRVWDGSNWNLVGPVLISVVNYLASQTITVPVGCTRAWARMWGATGGSGGVSNGTSGGTGAGGYLEKYLTGLTPGNTLVFTQGAAGAAGASGNSTGGPGTVTTLASGTQTIPLLTCNGSLGSVGGAPGVGAATAGATATGGDVNITGQSGIISNSQVSPGGSNQFSEGATGVTAAATAAGNPGNPGGMIVEWYS